jgi:predicted amidohydrolase
MESAQTMSGDKGVVVAGSPVGKLGLGICYDIRFSEQANLLGDKSQILVYPSAFTPPTGAAHWSTLVKFRAIETQCYVIAAAQCGRHSDKRSSYGHSCVIDPFGNVCCELDNVPGIGYADIDLDLVEKVRREMPLRKHKRSDLYTLREST